MANGEDRIRDLIRLIPAGRALRESLEENIHMERFAGIGDPAISLYQGFHTALMEITSDSYLASLSLNLPGDATDEQKIFFVHMATGQINAFLEGQIGIVGLGSGEGRKIQIEPKMAFEGPINTLYQTSEAFLGMLVEKGITPVEPSAENRPTDPNEPQA